jgi:hypothetical protein
LGALIVAILGVGAVALAGLQGSGAPKRTAAAKTRSTTAARTHHAAKPRAVARPTTPRTSTSTTPTTVAATSAPPSPEQLQLTGHQEMLDGNYSAAITTLQKAAAAAGPASLTYAYALYDEGRSLLLSGNPAAAVQVLEQRARIPNQTTTVLQTLNQALRANGQPPVPVPGQAPTGPGNQVPPDQGKKGAAGSGGAGLAPSHGHRHGNEHPNFVGGPASFVS